MNQNNLMLIVALFLFAGFVQASVVYDEFNGFDYKDYGANWTWEQVKTCSTSQVQSPIDLLSSDRNSTAPNQYMFARYETSKMLVRKFNTTIVMTAVNDDGLGYLYYITTLNVAGTFRLDNIRFRTPAEHTINGYQADMEVQLFHLYGFKKPVNDKVVVALLFKIDDKAPLDPLLEQVINTKHNETTSQEIDISRYLTMDSFQMNYFYYAGSLTYPYCSGSYNWVVIDQFFYAPSSQINAIHQAYQNTAGGLILKGNYRKTQNRTGRYVRYNGDATNPQAISNLHPQKKKGILNIDL
ncbi:eukaryotic-type carbonate dehydratase (macronuclear) [Tetrahymena thermophila SB210]|uniref:carbonic anhydrase n=1 Tax=Tetrahymena thermophila (strain SB210) TaxID=312017 RepID=Q24HK8_TETTS|nr:eukaryotic-type carbonate dehydratase [Tetrahymena thermophila SB210]EAS07223.1 eukaryotic-type carbonate dehydratase [Tetrahymena thermophila SB210]|eukprot:XP_001027465.1 eukaryotic-type carbonate dehydratase [Tetrahymena thermophila SB210]